jgi:hypothetical protein
MLSRLRSPSLLWQRLMTSSRPMLDKAQFVPGVLDFTYRATIKTVVFA